jgi:hypothetical protein
MQVGTSSGCGLQTTNSQWGIMWWWMWQMDIVTKLDWRWKGCIKIHAFSSQGPAYPETQLHYIVSCQEGSIHPSFEESGNFCFLQLVCIIEEQTQNQILSLVQVEIWLIMDLEERQCFHSPFETFAFVCRYHVWWSDLALHSWGHVLAISYSVCQINCTLL